jgi:hypothetical protein
MEFSLVSVWTTLSAIETGDSFMNTTLAPSRTEQVSQPRANFRTADGTNHKARYRIVMDADF